MPGNDLYLKSIFQWKEKVIGGLEALGRVAVQDLAEEVVDNTHIDTGFLVGNWQPGLNAPVLETDDGKLGAEVANSVIALSIIDLKLGDVFYYTNIVEYAKYQEYGTSKMAGVFMVTRAVEHWEGIVKGAAFKVGLA